MTAKQWMNCTVDVQESLIARYSNVFVEVPNKGKVKATEAVKAIKVPEAKTWPEPKPEAKPDDGATPA
jgi:hypothetical protein